MYNPVSTYGPPPANLYGTLVAPPPPHGSKYLPGR